MPPQVEENMSMDIAPTNVQVKRRGSPPLLAAHHPTGGRISTDQDHKGGMRHPSTATGTTTLLLLFLIGLNACARTSFAPSPTSLDAATDSIGAGRCTPWTGSWLMTPKAPVEEFTDIVSPSNFFFSANDLTLYFSIVAKDANRTDRDIYYVTRKSRAAPFGTPKLVPGIASPDSEGGATLSADGTEIWFTRLSTGSQTNTDIWYGHRTRITDPFSEIVPVEALNTTSNEWDLHLTVNGLHLYFAPQVPYQRQEQEIVFVSRKDRSAPFTGPITPLKEINSSVEDAEPSLSADELVITFVSDRPGGLGGRDVWYATRPTKTATFSKPKPFSASINSSAEESEATLSHDGCELVFKVGNVLHRSYFVQR